MTEATEPTNPADRFFEIASAYEIDPDLLLNAFGFTPQLRTIVDAVHSLVSDQYMDDGPAAEFVDKVYGSIPDEVIEAKALQLQLAIYATA
jgi:hypothetical protein